MSPRPRPPHQQFVGRLFAVLDEWAQRHHLGEVYPDVEMRLDDQWTPAPDLVFVAAEHVDRVGDTQIIGPADLAVEVLSPSNVNDDRVGSSGLCRQRHPLVLDRRSGPASLGGIRLLNGDFYGNHIDAPFDRPFARLFPGLSIDLARLAG